MACVGTIAAAALSLTLVSNGPDSGATVIGTEAPFPPYIVVDASGQITGFERDIADQVCLRADLNCVWKTVQFDQLLPGVMAGDFDIVLGGMAVTPDRMRLVDFSLSYEQSQESHSIYGLPGAPIPALARIGVQSGTIHETYARSMGWNSFSYATGTEVVTALRAGTVDLAFGALTSEIAAYPEIQSLFAEDIPDLGTAMAVCRGNNALLTKINAALQDMLDDGTIDAITARWL